MKAVLLDRDGVINALVYHKEAGIIDAPFKRSQFKLLPRVPKAIRMLNDLGLRVAIVSNQPGIAKGHMKPDMLKAFERCYVIGDGIPDLLAGSRAGCRTIFIGRWKCEICQFTEAPHVRPAFVAKDLWEAAQLIRSEMAGTGQVASSPNCLVAQA